MNVYEAAVNRRTIRKFEQREIPAEILRKLVNAARLSPSAANVQPLRYLIVEKKDAPRVFPCLKWAGYIAPEGNPQEGEKPCAYIVILAKSKAQGSWEHDSGAAAMTIQLCAYEEGIASCWIGSVDRERLSREFMIPQEYKIDTVLALGYPAEKSEAVDYSGSVKYWKDEKGTYHVPKYSLEEVLL